ncbi:hypothetical protein AcV5_009403 [Taiwanofungus camphoratus]|nr:hypothetical protein AcV5_009403 [Antrodia cinnamomea]
MNILSSSRPHLSNVGPPLRVETDPHAGRTYHATRSILAGSNVLEASTPYAYTIWKQFRNEVCAECWRYEGGRRGFLTLRDDEGLNLKGDPSETFVGDNQRQVKRQVKTGAGLWFCGECCRSAWIAREGIDTLGLFRSLEEARRKKGKAKEGVAADPDVKSKVTEEVIERAWGAIREKESIPKQVKKWREIHLDDFETDMARYVLLALVHLYRERQRQTRMDSLSHAAPVFETYNTDGILGHNRDKLEFGGATWNCFASLQSNELHHIKTYPELLENQIRIYQVLKGRFTVGAASDQGRFGPNTRYGQSGIVQRDAGGRHQDRSVQIGQEGAGEACEAFRGLESVITIANVRTALSVDPGNSFGIWEIPLTDESECLGFAVYPILSFFNHHCSPNVGKARDGRGLRFAVNQPVKAGEELCISYGHVETMEWKARRKELLEGWFFECRCSRCIADTTSG